MTDTISVQEITPTIVAERHPKGKVIIYEFTAPKDESGCYGLIYRTSYRSGNIGDWHRCYNPETF